MAMSSLPILLLLLCVSSSLSQTFQYSRGWTNGKKRSIENLPVVADLHMAAPLRKEMMAADWRNFKNQQMQPIYKSIDWSVYSHAEPKPRLLKNIRPISIKNAERI